MRAGRVPAATLLLLFAFSIIQVSTAGDLYLEGEEDSSNEFLEVNDKDVGILDNLKRFKRQWFSNPFDLFSTKSDDSDDSATESVDDGAGYGKDDDIDNFGSGSVAEQTEPEPREKTLRVTFTVVEPYQTAYSNRDSPEFLDFSRSLANAVDQLFDSLPGTQRSSLVRIQSQINDEFSCKVTLDIVTTGYDDTDNIRELLKNHITTYKRLSKTIVNENDFSAQVIDPANAPDDASPDYTYPVDQNNYNQGSDNTNNYYTPEEPNNLEPNIYNQTNYNQNPDNQNNYGQNPDENIPTPRSDDIRNGNSNTDFSTSPTPNIYNANENPDDGNSNTESPDQNNYYTHRDNNNYAPPVTNNQNNYGPPDDRENQIDSDAGRGDGGRVGDNEDIPSATTQSTLSPEEEQWPSEISTTPPNDYVTNSDRGYSYPSYSPEPEDCLPDYLRCDETRCVEKTRRCDGVSDCADGEDEAGCPDLTCGSDDFRCNNGKCIEPSRRCDRIYDCLDQEDERGCECRPDEFRCESDGACIEERKRCDGVPQCNDGSDEQQCQSTCPPDQVVCQGGSVLCAEKCNDIPECDGGEDETNCAACAHQCDGKCIPAAQVCDNREDCADGSDESQCQFCNKPEDFRCNSGECLLFALKCNGIPECEDSSDELYCNQTMISNNAQCTAEQFQCLSNLVCIDINFYCDNHKDCIDGSDEMNCPCPTDSWQCRDGQCILSSGYCDNIPDCDDGTDESDCNWSTQRPYVAPSTNRIPSTTSNVFSPTERTTSRYPDSRYPDSGYPDSGYPDSRYPDSRYPDSRYPDSRYPDSRYPDNRYPDSRYPDSRYPGSRYPGSGYPDGTSNGQGGDRRNDPSSGYPGGNGAGGPDSGSDNGGQDGDRWNVPSGGYPDVSGGTDNRGEPGRGSGSALGGGPGNAPDNGYPNGGASGGSDSDDNRGTSGGPGSDGGNGQDSDRWNIPGRGYPDSDPSGLPGRGSGDSRGLSGLPGRPGGRPLALKLMTEPSSQTVRYANAGGDVVFQCRDEGPQRAAVQWRMIGRPIKEGSSDVRGRLEMYGVTKADSGIYICEAVNFVGYPGSQARVTLQVDSAPVTYRPPFPSCQLYEATCGNGQCIPKAGVCNGRVDCSDGSDEENCHHEGMCEPNQFKCNNRKCVLKSWICDSEDDCGDGSDEVNCGTRPEGACSPVEFACKSQDQCIPKSFHCDGQSDCQDGSDEIGCIPVHVTLPPQPSNVRLNPGDTLILRSEAVGVPVPVISWRLNWGHVPAKCTWTSDGGIGVLTCPNMQPEDSGAYSSEAINNKGATFATPDAIVIVNKTDLCPRGYFNNEARSESECIRCFCFGKSTQCRSADLFTYNMPVPLGEGGTRLIGVKVSPNGDVNVDTQTISNQYYYQPLRNGATVTKFGDVSSWSNAHPYLTLPETYNGNQLKSYGGHIKYTLSPQTEDYGFEEAAATIIIKAKYGNLFHMNRASGTRDINIEARFTPEGWSKYPDGSVPATREDIMMALDDIQMILLRADLNNAGVNITDFAMESADHLNVGLGAASLVEECTCPKGYEGLSCQKCASGFIRKQVGPWLGDCEPEECPAGTYGDPSSGLACKPCPCPLTNRENQFARTCSLGPDGSVICDCFQGYEGQHCEICAPGYEGNPLIPGNTCQPKKSDNCNPVGTKSIRPPDECVCKVNVQGRYCDQCKDDSFFLSSEFRQGCATCFCTGVTQQCKSSNYRRRTISAQFNVPQIVNEVKIFDSAAAGLGGSVRYAAPKETNLTAVLNLGEVSVQNLRSFGSNIYYWSMPVSFAGDKVTSYGGYLRYTLKNVPNVDPRYINTAADAQLLSINGLTFHYKGNFTASSDRLLNASIRLLEDGWKRPDGGEISRPSFLLALADVKTILIKATYTSGSPLASPVSASIDIAEPDANGPIAFHVEQCNCPTGYIGTSCEDCAPGYRRSFSGLYLEHCDLCECNGKSSMCNPETGVCYDCAQNTDGDHCERCKPGYQLDPYGNCVEIQSSTIEPCRCDPRGTAIPCDEAGNCHCKQNVEGDDCDTCRPGTFGLDAANNDGCLSCYCSGVTADCHEGNHYTRVPIAAPVLGDNYGGFTITDLNAEQVIKDHFVPLFEQSELMYTFQFSPDIELYWSLPIFPGNRVLSYGGTLSLRQKFSSENDMWSERGTDVVLDGGDISIFWTNPNQFQSGKSYSYQVPLKEEGWLILNTATPATRSNFMSVLKNLKRVLIRATVAQYIYETTIADVSMDTATQSYSPLLPVAKGIEICMCPEGYTGTSCETCKSGYYKDALGYCRKCSCNGHDCQLDNYGQVVCNCQPPYTGYDCSTIGGDSSVTELTTRQPQPPESTVSVTIISPTIKIQEIGSSVNFTCQAQSRNSRGRLPVTWSKSDGNLPQGRTYVDENNGYLVITNLQVSDSGVYICETNDGINTAQASATLKVPGNEMTPPSVEIFPSVKEYYEGDPIELECRVKGNPIPSIRWQRGSNKPLPLSAENRGSLLIIESASIEDAGEYRCIASNRVGSDDRTAMITIRPRPSWPTADKLTISNTSPTVDEGQSIRIVCTGSTNVPAGSLEWARQDNALFLPNVRSENGVLYIEYAETANQGVYICRSSQSSVAAVPVLLSVVTLNPEPEVYNITVSVDRLKIPTGGSGTVDCNPVGRPLPLIKWTKHDGGLGADSSQRDNTLIINNARQSDEGYYLCEGTVDGVPVASVYVFVEVERREPPVVRIWPEGEQSVILGGQFELHCRVMSGIPEPYVTWNRNGGRPLSPSTQIQPHNVLKFNNIDVNDEGEYTCEARNDAGSVTASSVIKVRSPPEITITPSDYIQVINGEPFNVDCRANGYPEPMVSISLNDRQLVPPQPGHATLRVASASYKDNDYYTCTATSVAGSITNQFAVVVDRGDGGVDDNTFHNYEEGSGDINIDPDDTRPDGTDWPIIYEQPKDQYVIEGQRETIIYCNETGNVRWSRADNMPLQRNAYQADTRLVILNVSKSDSGEYMCNIYNEYNEVQHAVHISLVVVSAPKITLRPQIQTVQPGQSPTVECVVEGDDIIDIDWKRHDRSPSSRMEVNYNMLIFHRIEVEDAGEYECVARSRYANISAIAEVNVTGPRHQETVQLVNIEQPRTTFRVGDNVNILCRIRSKDVRTQWLRPGTNQYIPALTYGDGAILSIQGITFADAGVYRCVGSDPEGRNSFDDVELKIELGSGNPSYPNGGNINVAEYSARLRDSVELPCQHDLELPVTIEWRREFSPLPSEIRSNQPNLHLPSVTEADAGTYICRVSNSRTAVEAMAILTVKGVVPRFDGKSFISLPTLKDAFRQFEIEISFKPTDENGLLLYNSQNQGREGDFIALQLVNGVPEFIMDTGTELIKEVKYDRPLQLNTWHTIRLSRTDSKVTMDVDNRGPFIVVSPEQWAVLDLNQPLYIGGVPDYEQLPIKLAGASGFIGCVSMLILGKEEKTIMTDGYEQVGITECDTCNPNLCLNNGFCQEARNERGYMCICATGYAGLNCDRTGEACRPGLCGPGKCSDTDTGYKCACPVTRTGKNCEVTQSIEYPAFTGSAYLAIKPPGPSRTLKMSMNIKAATPVTDGLIMYCAESSRGYGGFTSLAVHDGRLEFRYDLGRGSKPVVLVSNRTLPANEWTNVHIARIGSLVSLKINSVYSYEERLAPPNNQRNLPLDTPIFVGGIDDSITLNNNTGVSGGFNGCIKDFTMHGQAVDIVNQTIQSANVQECVSSVEDRGDIPEAENIVCQCRNGGQCISAEPTSCSCPSGFVGQLCEYRSPLSAREGRSSDPCALRPCRNGGTCRPDPSSRMNHTCDCPLGYAGVYCQMPLELLESVAFNGNGYMELPASLIDYTRLDIEPAMIVLALHTTSDGVLVYQKEAQSPPDYGDYILLRIERGIVVIDWDLGGGKSSVSVGDVFVNDGERHQIIAKLLMDGQVTLSVDGIQNSGSSMGISNIMNADSNIYLGGIPDQINQHAYPGFVGCIEQLELMDSNRGLKLSQLAVAGRNTQRCKELRHNV